jgi:hypothetical protein
MNKNFKAICIKEIESGRCAKLLHIYEFKPEVLRHRPDGTPFEDYPGVLECNETSGFHFIDVEKFDKHFKVLND